MLALLQSHGHLTGADMAQRLEVNIRTLRRYITMLQDLGIPIITERGRNGSTHRSPQAGSSEERLRDLAAAQFASAARMRAQLRVPL